MTPSEVTLYAIAAASAASLLATLYRLGVHDGQRHAASEAEAWRAAYHAKCDELAAAASIRRQYASLPGTHRRTRANASRTESSTPTPPSDSPQSPSL